MSRRRTIAVYGGSFDPPHVAHVLGAAYVLSAGGVDALWVLPTATHAFAKRLSPFEVRLELARRAFAIFGERVVVRDDEATVDAGGSTLALLEHLARLHPDVDFRLVLGTDQVAVRHRWRRFDAIEAMAPLIVLGRPGVAVDPDYPPAVWLPAISSTSLRQRIAAGASVAAELPRDVAAEIARVGLYRELEP